MLDLMSSSRVSGLCVLFSRSVKLIGRNGVFI